ncbi:D-alanyl-D-alanine carboxypeptidase [candidate division WWE3 bacterium]|nr:D-alanyl-D-alanine carboxypeptidase [candidate division WWE3 bacterium]
MFGYSLDLSQKFKLNLVFLAINFLWFLDDFYIFLKRGVLSLGRVSLYLILVTSFFQAFYLETSVPDFGAYSYVLTPTVGKVLGAATTAYEYPLLISQNSITDITATSIFVKDVTSGKILIAKDADVKKAPASTVKLMTALVAFDLYKTNEIVSIPDICTKIEGQKNGFSPDTQYRFEELISSMLINSSADAACALSLGKTTYVDFVERMNVKSRTLFLDSTHFTNPIGLDDLNGDQFSTAQDLYALSIEARKTPLIKQLVSTREKVIQSLPDPKKGILSEEIKVLNTNKLLWEVSGTVGIKTGKTEAAGEVLIYEYDKDAKNLIIVVMGSQDRFTDTKKILDWVLTNYVWEDKEKQI